MSDVFTSVILVTFRSDVQFDNWLAKFRTFYNEKAVEFLREDRQISQSASRVQGDYLIRITIIWAYRDYDAYEKCQKFHGQWGKVGGQFIAKASGYRGYEVWSDLDVTLQNNWKAFKRSHCIIRFPGSFTRRLYHFYKFS